MILPISGAITIYGGNLNQALGTSVNEVGNLCSDAYNGSTHTASRINKWAKRKPVRRNKTAALTDAERSGASGSIVTDYYGLTLPKEYSNPIDAGQDSASGTKSFTYLRPRGKYVSGEPCRMLDFRGYKTDATPPISPLPECRMNKGSQSSFGFYFSYRATGDDYEYGLSEMLIELPSYITKKYLSDCYLAMAFQYNGTVYYKTTDYKIGETEAGNAIVFNGERDLPSYTGTVTVDYYLVACLEKKFDEYDVPTGGQRFYPLPFADLNAGKGSLILENTIPTYVTVELLRISHQLPASATWGGTPTEAISKYAPQSQFGPEDQYFNITDAEPEIHFGFKVTNNGTSSFTINCQAARMNLTPSAYSGNSCGGIEGMSVHSVYYASSELEVMSTGSWSVNIPAGQSRYFFFRSVEAFGKYDNGTRQYGNLPYKKFKGALVTLLVGDTRISAQNAYVNIEYGSR